MKTIRKFSLVLLSMVLLFTLTSCDETGAVSVDTAKVEKSVLSVMNSFGHRFHQRRKPAGQSGLYLG